MKLERIWNIKLRGWWAYHSIADIKKKKKTQLSLLLDLFYYGREELCWSNRVLPDQSQPLILYRILREHGVKALEDFQKLKWVHIVYLGKTIVD